VRMRFPVREEIADQLLPDVSSDLGLGDVRHVYDLTPSWSYPEC
jgi:hypothetical protein